MFFLFFNFFHHVSPPRGEYLPGLMFNDPFILGYQSDEAQEGRYSDGHSHYDQPTYLSDSHSNSQDDQGHSQHARDKQVSYPSVDHNSGQYDVSRQDKTKKRIACVPCLSHLHMGPSTSHPLYYIGL